MGNSTFTVTAKMVKFHYYFQVYGHEKIDGKATITISGEPDENRINEKVEDYIRGIISEFVVSEKIRTDGGISVSLNVTVTDIIPLKTEITMTPRRN